MKMLKQAHSERPTAIRTSHLKHLNQIKAITSPSQPKYHTLLTSYTFADRKQSYNRVLKRPQPAVCLHHQTTPPFPRKLR